METAWQQSPPPLPSLYLGPQVQDQVLHHPPEGLGQRQQLVQEVVASPEAHDVDHPHPLRTDGRHGARLDPE